MSDVNSSLPIRTEAAGDVQVKVVDATLTSQQLKVNANGSVDVNLLSTDVDIRDLVFATDKVDVTGSEVKVTDGTDDLAINADGSVNITDNGGSLTVDATDLDIRDLTHVSDSVKVGDGTDLLAVNADGSVNITDNGSSLTVDATDLDIRDLTHASDSVKVGDGTDLLAVNADGSINVVVLDGTPGTAIVDYDTSANIAGGASDTHTYTATGTFYLQQVEASSSGKMKIEVQLNGVTKFVQFNSTANPNLNIHIDNPIPVTTGQTVTVIRTNKEGQAQDVYSTIVGYNA